MENISGENRKTESIRDQSKHWLFVLSMSYHHSTDETMTSGKGENVVCKGTVIIMTGAEVTASSQKRHQSTYKLCKSAICNYEIYLRYQETHGTTQCALTTDEELYLQIGNSRTNIPDPKHMLLSELSSVLWFYKWSFLLSAQASSTKLHLSPQISALAITGLGCSGGSSKCS